MALYLQMDGVDDRLQTPSITFNEVVMSVEVIKPTVGNEYLFDARTGRANGYIFIQIDGISRSTSTSPFLGVNGKTYVDGVQKTSSSNLGIPLSQKTEIQLVSNTSGTDDVNFFSSSNNDSILEGKIYDIKFLNTGVLVAHYDMSTGTVQDQSGNGNHASLTGGTWLDDGTGGGNTDITITSVLATSTADAIAPTISTVSSISASIDVLTATVTADVFSPSVEGIRNVSLVSVVADAIADSIAPSVVSGPLSVQVMAVISSLVSNALAPTIVIKREIISKLTLNGKVDSPLLLQGRSHSISLNGTTSQSIRWKGGIQ